MIAETVHDNAQLTEEQKAEDAFRQMAFHTLYNRSCADIVDSTVRFATALVKSAQPIRDRDRLMEWWWERKMSHGRRRWPS